MMKYQSEGEEKIPRVTMCLTMARRKGTHSEKSVKTNHVEEEEMEESRWK